MSAQILNGREVAQGIRETIKERVDTRLQQGLPRPGLAVIIVGDDPASHLYIQNKRKACEEVGFYSQILHLPERTKQDDLIDIIIKLNEDPQIHGILVQLPLPKHINIHLILEKVDPKKDVDGFHPYNLGRLAQRNPTLRPCTPYGIIKLLNYYKINLRGMNATIVGASLIVGRPLFLELLMQDVTVTVCHSYTRDLKEHIKKADLVVVAIGKLDVIDSAWIKRGAIVIDVGTNRLEDNTVAGDIDFETAQKRAAWITPVPGGVGPMTIACLLENTLLACEKI